MTVRRRTGWALGLALVALLAAGCSDGPTLDRAGTERAVEKVIGGRITQPIDEVVCPAHMRKGAGREATCTAVLAGGAGKVRLRVRQADGDADLEISLIDAVVDRTVAARALHRELVETYGRTFTVTCGDGGPIVAPPGDTFDCKAADATTTRKVRGEIVDPAGTVRFDVGTAPTTTTTTSTSTSTTVPTTPPA